MVILAFLDVMPIDHMMYDFCCSLSRLHSVMLNLSVHLEGVELFIPPDKVLLLEYCIQIVGRSTP
jgi:hypothetical protein